MTLLSALLSLVFLMTVGLRLVAAGQLVRRRWRRTHHVSAVAIPDADLPRYTILVPLFREAGVLPALVANLRALEYPAVKLDIKLILESVDTETIAAARAMDLPGNFDIITVPDGQPRTKPKACNFALEYATGDFAVIFDAEDRPEPDQLRKAVEMFAAAPSEVVCLQAKLNFDNPSENWLAKQFTIEYTSLFWGILPALDTLRLPIPLGGTSNHFRMNALRELGAWDAFNVTEDADLGMRIYRAGWRCKVLDSTTWEEAACQPGNWLRQRTRWLKGWMQTYAVHMRQPRGLRGELGPGGFWAFQGLFAAVVISTLAHPLFYILLAYDGIYGGFMHQAESLLGLHFWVIATFNLVAGYGAAIVLGVVSLRARGVADLLPQILLIPVYWLCISVAAWRALYQLIANPFYWEKTEHGISKVPRKAS
jgi:cellulose synthase/poly-beta-1,6-N-acetylglucosamine synthase-like glycosyltransferase